MTKSFVTAYVALGANLGDAIAAVQQAIKALGHIVDCTVMRSSSLYQSSPLKTQPSHFDLGGEYINAVVQISTGLTPVDLLLELQSLEQLAGRRRSYLDAPRTLDLDLLLYGSVCMQSEQLTLPHPRMWQRAFVLLPLHEIAPQLVSAAQLQAVAQQDIRHVF